MITPIVRVGHCSVKPGKTGVPFRARPWQRRSASSDGSRGDPRTEEMFPRSRSRFRGWRFV